MFGDKTLHHRVRPCSALMQCEINDIAVIALEAECWKWSCFRVRRKYLSGTKQNNLIQNKICATELSYQMNVQFRPNYYKICCEHQPAINLILNLVNFSSRGYYTYHISCMVQMSEKSVIASATLVLIWFRKRHHGQQGLQPPSLKVAMTSHL